MPQKLPQTASRGEEKASSRCFTSFQTLSSGEWALSLLRSSSDRTTHLWIGVQTVRHFTRLVAGRRVSQHAVEPIGGRWRAPKRDEQSQSADEGRQSPHFACGNLNKHTLRSFPPVSKSCRGLAGTQSHARCSGIFKVLERS